MEIVENLLMVEEEETGEGRIEVGTAVAMDDGRNSKLAYIETCLALQLLLPDLIVVFHKAKQMPVLDFPT